MIESVEPLESRIARLDADQAREVIRSLARDHPEVRGDIDRSIAVADPPRATELPPLDIKAIRSRVRSAARPPRSRRSWEEYGFASDAVNEVYQVLERANEMTKAGRASDALSVLEAIMEEFAGSFEEIDDSDGEIGAFFIEDVPPAWASAALTADLTSSERTKWIEKLEGWEGELDDYGAGDGMAAAIAAFREGSNPDWLARILTDQSAEADRKIAAESKLTPIRVEMLEDRGEVEQALRLADAALLTPTITRLLLRLGRFDDAVSVALDRFTQRSEALKLAEGLLSADRRDDAFRVAERGLALAGWDAGVARWIVANVTRTDNAERLDLLTTAVLIEPTLAGYNKLHEFSGESWPGLRERILTTIESARSTSHEAIGILLAEGRVDAALGFADAVSHDTLSDIVSAAVATRPERAYEISVTQAEPIMDAGQARHYDIAVDWLSRARAARFATGDREGWNRYVSVLLVKHNRKYKLVGLIRDLERAQL